MSEVNYGQKAQNFEFLWVMGLPRLLLIPFLVLVTSGNMDRLKKTLGDPT